MRLLHLDQVLVGLPLLLFSFRPLFLQCLDHRVDLECQPLVAKLVPLDLLLQREGCLSLLLEEALRLRELLGPLLGLATLFVDDEFELVELVPVLVHFEVDLVAEVLDVGMEACNLAVFLANLLVCSNDLLVLFFQQSFLFEQSLLQALLSQFLCLISELKLVPVAVRFVQLLCRLIEVPPYSLELIFQSLELCRLRLLDQAEVLQELVLLLNFDLLHIQELRLVLQIVRTDDIFLLLLAQGYDLSVHCLFEQL